ncbi:ornithine--oxo-acid transaminase, partial [Streptomyces cavourensis]|nr:ornithine--oxo-acid transaminase [Streptomyces cavourensis]
INQVSINEDRKKAVAFSSDIAPALGTGREISERLLAERVLVKDTHGSTIRIAPPLVISKEDLDWGLDRLRTVLSVP